MAEPQINLTMSVALFHCPLKPPTFKCEVGHVVCSTCRGDHGQACSGAATYAACVDVDAFVGDAKLPCAYEEFGCKSYVVYNDAADHHRACQHAPYSCPDPGCAFFSSPARLLGHLAADHAWHVTDVGYGKPCTLAVPPPQSWHVLVCEEDRCMFLVSSSALGATTAVSLVCVRTNGDAAAQFKCTLWAEAPRNRGNMAMMTSVVGSNNLSRGFVAANQGMFLAVPPELRHDASGEAPILRVRIDKAGAAAAAKSTTPSATCRSLLQ